jgi:predicted DNA-binding protein
MPKGRPTSDNRMMDTVTFRIPAELKARADAAAKAEDRPLASWLRMAIEAHLKSQKK